VWEGSALLCSLGSPCETLSLLEGFNFQGIVDKAFSLAS